MYVMYSLKIILFLLQYVECIGILTVGELTNPDLMKFTRVLYPWSVAL